LVGESPKETAAMASESSTLPMKQQLIAALQDLPDSATFDDVLERLHFVYSVQVGLAQADRGMLIPHEQVKKDLRDWAR
jgi:predicted transcriptional regulator